MHALVVPDGGVLGGGRGVFEMLSEGLKVNGVSMSAHLGSGANVVRNAWVIWISSGNVADEPYAATGV